MLGKFLTIRVLNWEIILVSIFSGRYMRYTVDAKKDMVTMKTIVMAKCSLTEK